MGGPTEHGERASASRVPVPETAPPPASAWRRLPRGIWALGLVSLFMDVSSEMIHALLPVYLTVELGVTALAVGMLEGVAEATRRQAEVAGLTVAALPPSWDVDRPSDLIRLKDLPPGSPAARSRALLTNALLYTGGSRGLG